MNFAVSVALSAEEQSTKEHWRAALDRFLQADAVANVAAIKARIADTYFRLGDYQKPVEFEHQAVDLAPNWSVRPYILALSLVRLGRIPDAMPHAQRSCNLGFSAACSLIQEIGTTAQPSPVQTGGRDVRPQAASGASPLRECPKALLECLGRLHIDKLSVSVIHPPSCSKVSMILMTNRCFVLDKACRRWACRMALGDKRCFRTLG